MNRSKHKYCSIDCFKLDKMEYMRGEGNHQYGLRGKENASWKSDIRISTYGYVLRRMPEHPFCNIDGFVFEHRLIAEEYLLNDANSVLIHGKRYPGYALDATASLRNVAISPFLAMR